MTIWNDFFVEWLLSDRLFLVDHNDTTMAKVGIAWAEKPILFENTKSGIDLDGFS